MGLGKEFMLSQTFLPPRRTSCNTNCRPVYTRTRRQSGRQGTDFVRIAGADMVSNTLQSISHSATVRLRSGDIFRPDAGIVPHSELLACRRRVLLRVKWNLTTHPGRGISVAPKSCAVSAPTTRSLRTPLESLARSRWSILPNRAHDHQGTARPRKCRATGRRLQLVPPLKI